MSRQLDVEIAEKVMGFVRDDRYGKDWWLKAGAYYCDSSELPDFSSHIADAWLVVQRFANERCYVCMELDADGVWHVAFGRFLGQMSTNPAEAICLAGLQAVELLKVSA